jgi:hypothetical protein
MNLKHHVTLAYKTVWPAKPSTTLVGVVRKDRHDQYALGYKLRGEAAPAAGRILFH